MSYTGKTSLSLRPYELMCIVCKIGAGKSGFRNKRLTEILKKIRKQPDMPVTLQCNTDSVYEYQNPGKKSSSCGGQLFNKKHDLDILQRLGLVPGATRPARVLFNRLLQNITTTQDICGYKDNNSKDWKGCDYAFTGNYEKGQAKGSRAIIRLRTTKAMTAAKKRSVRLMRSAKRLLIRPHHLICMTCFFGDHMDKFEPIDEDNLYEVIDIMRKNPNIPVTLVRGCCMICPPCPDYDVKNNLCVGSNSMSLRDEKKDLDVLQQLDLQYGNTLPAKELYALLFKKIYSTKQICGYGDGAVRAPEWSVCGSPKGKYVYCKYSAKEPYKKGRRAIS